LRGLLEAEAAAGLHRLGGAAMLERQAQWARMVRLPLRPFWRPFCLGFTYVTSVLVKKY
jgi:hypothetical protein